MSFDIARIGENVMQEDRVLDISSDSKESDVIQTTPFEWDDSKADIRENENDGTIRFCEPLPSEFPLFAHYDCKPLVLHILGYLTASELCVLSNASRSMYMAVLSPFLWKPLLLMDFFLDENQINAINATPNDHNVPSEASATKKYYVQQFRDASLSIAVAKMNHINHKRELDRDRRTKCVECCLDTSMVRMYTPLPIASIITTLILVALRNGGHNISIWWCLAPTIFFVLYTLLSGVLTYVVYLHRHSRDGLLGNELWVRLRSPAQMLYETSSESSRAVQCAVIVCVLLLLQLLLLGIKTSSSDYIRQDLRSGLHWGIVFVPLWILLAIYLAAPIVGVYSGGPGPFFTLLVLCWIPFFILLTCLTVKLSGIEENEREGRMRIALIIMPFWVLEGVLMVGTLAGLINGIYRCGNVGVGLVCV